MSEEKPNQYHNGRIYKIVCGDLTYIGSTCQPLSKRMANHRKCYKCWKNGKNNYIYSFKLFDIGDPQIVLIEECKCDNKEQLLRRERHYIENMDCVNKAIPGGRHNENKDKIAERKAKWYLLNKEKILKKTAEYRSNNIEKIAKYQQEYKRHQN